MLRNGIFSADVLDGRVDPWSPHPFAAQYAVQIIFRNSFGVVKYGGPKNRGNEPAEWTGLLLQDIFKAPKIVYIRMFLAVTDLDAFEINFGTDGT